MIDVDKLVFGKVYSSYRGGIKYELQWSEKNTKESYNISKIKSSIFIFLGVVRHFTIGDVELFWIKCLVNGKLLYAIDCEKGYITFKEPE